MEETSFLPSDAIMPERLVCIRDRITSRPVCSNCKNFVKFNTDGYYPKYCSKQCYGKRLPTPRNISKEEILQAYENDSMSGVARHFKITEHQLQKLFIQFNIKKKSPRDACAAANKKYLSKPSERKQFSHSLLSNKDWLYDVRINKRMSKEAIAELANCSVTIVNSYIDKFNIPLVRYNESESSTKAKLNNRFLLENLYKTNTMEEIAIAIGSSKATVALAFEKLGIVAKKPNSYDRPFSRISKGHQEVVDFVSTYYKNDILINNRSLIGTEIDILLPDIKFGIEYNGLYHHSEKPEQENNSLRKGKEYHYNKTSLCIDNGYQLFHLFEDQWTNKTDIVKSMIMSKLRLNKTVYARKCSIKQINRMQSKQFFEKNHIQGKDNSSITYALFLDGNIISAMSFNSPRFNKNFEWELVRFATILNINCVGAFSKLLAHFVRNHSGSLISYSDNTYSLGNVYMANGFELLHENKPGYWYVSPDYQIRYPRTMFTKSQLKRKFDISDNLTEKDAMTLLGFKRIWNCGTKAWVYRQK